MYMHKHHESVAIASVMHVGNVSLNDRIACAHAYNNHEAYWFCMHGYTALTGMVGGSLISASGRHDMSNVDRYI